MIDLLKAFDSYNDFERKSYFALVFNSIASELLLETPIVSSKKNIDQVLNILRFDDREFNTVFKNWTTEDSNNADFSKDYAYQYLLKSENQKCLVWISMSDETLYIEFLYDCTDSELEQWIIETNHKIRQKFGLSRTPTFKVLTKKRNGFGTEEVSFENQIIDVKANYNDDFYEVDRKITESFETLNSGLILLYGVPGTGKTTYIKNVISKYSSLNFIFVQNEFIKHLLEPDFISFLLKQRNSILIIEDAEKVLTARSQFKEDSFVSTILQLTDGLFSDYLNIKIVCTFNISLSQIDKALLRKGRIIAKYEFKQLDQAKTKSLLATMGISGEKEELTISEIYNYNNEDHQAKDSNRIGF